MNEACNCRFVQKFRILMLKNIGTLVGSYVYERIKSKTSGKICVNVKMKSFSNETLKFSRSPIFPILPKCNSSANLVAEIQLKHLKETVLSTGEPYWRK